MITKGASPGTSPGRERLALVGVGLAAGTAGFHKLLRRRIEDAGEQKMIQIFAACTAAQGPRCN